MFNEETNTLCCLAILHNTNETFPLVLSILPTTLARHQSTFSIACKQVREVPSHETFSTSNISSRSLEKHD